jgi:hypothetical protein
MPPSPESDRDDPWGELIGSLEAIDWHPANAHPELEGPERDRVQALYALVVVNHALKAAGARSIALERLEGALTHLNQSGRHLPVLTGASRDSDGAATGSTAKRGGAPVPIDVLAARGKIAAVIVYALETDPSLSMMQACQWATRAIQRCKGPAFRTLSDRTISRWVHAYRSESAEGVGAFNFGRMHRLLRARGAELKLSRTDLEDDLAQIVIGPSDSGRETRP